MTVKKSGSLLKESENSVVTYGEEEGAEWKLSKYSVSKAGTQFSLIKAGHSEASFSLNIPGRFNAKNAVGAVLAGRQFGLSDEEIQKGLTAFSGVGRRFEKIAEINSTSLYDDYAHHPDEVKATLATAREIFTDKRIIAIFQPHTYSRTKMLLDEFSKSFFDADESIITDIFASAREEKILKLTHRCWLMPLEQKRLNIFPIMQQ
jgi:UDP-N-acetylmuramate--alanine ligase